MANIPSIPYSAPVQSPELGVKVDPRAQIARIGAAGNVASEALGVITDYELRKQKAEEVAGFNQASITLNKTTAEYQHNLKTMDDRQIVPKWTEVAAKTKNDLMKQTAGWTPAAKRKFQQTLDTWQADSTIQMQVHADSLGSQRRKATAVAASQEFLQTGDPSMLGNAKAALKAAKDAGDMTPEEYDHHVNSLTRGLQENQILNGIDADPVATLKDLKKGAFPDVPEKQRLQLQTKAERAVAVVQNQGRDEMLVRLDNGETLDESEIRSQEKAGKISPAGAKAIRLRMEQKGMKEAKDDHALLMMEADDHSWVEDKDPEKSAKQMKDEGASLPPTLRKSLYEHIDAKVRQATRADAAKERPVQTNAMEQAKSYYKQGLFLPPVNETITHWFKPDETKQREPTTAERQNWEKNVPNEVADQARLNYARYLTKMRGFFKDHPDATDEDAALYSQSLLKPHLQNVVEQSLVPVPAPVGNPDIDKLLKKYAKP